MNKIINLCLGEGLAGSMRSALYVSRCLKELELDVLTVLSKNSAGKKLAEAYKLKIIECPNNNPYNIARLIKKISTHQNYNIFISHTSLDRKVLLLAYLVGLRGYFISYRRNQPKTLPVVGYILGSFFFDRFIAVSEGVKKNLIKKGFPEHKIVVIKNAIDIKEFNDISPDKVNNLRRRLNLSEDIPVLGMVSAFHEKRKGFDVIFKALSLLDIPCWLLIIGIEQRHKARVIELAKKYNVCHKIKILSFIDFLEIPAYYQLMDLFILPSRSEGLPLALLEAKAAKRCIIASDIEGVREVLKDSKDALLFTPGDPISLYQKIKYLLLNKQLRHKLASIVSEENNLDTLKKQLLLLIKHIYN